MVNKDYWMVSEKKKKKKRGTFDLHKTHPFFIIYYILYIAIAKFKTGTKTLKQHRMDEDGVDQKDRSLQHIHATPNTKVAREGQV